MFSYLYRTRCYVLVDEFQVLQFAILLVVVLVNHFDDSIHVFPFKWREEEIFFMYRVEIGV